MLLLLMVLFPMDLELFMETPSTASAPTLPRRSWRCSCRRPSGWRRWLVEGSRAATSPNFLSCILVLVILLVPVFLLLRVILIVPPALVVWVLIRACSGTSPRLTPSRACSGVDPDGPLALGTVLTHSDLNGLIVMKGNTAIMDLNAVDMVTVRLVVGSVAEAMEIFRRAWTSLTPRSSGPADDGGPAAARAAAPAKPAAAAPDDARTLPVERNSAGERFRTFRPVAETSSQIDFSDWPFDGPRTAAWLSREIGRTGMGPAAGHGQWKHENRLQDDDHHCRVHELLSELLEFFGCVDQLDVTNPAGLESLSRHLQYLEFEVKKMDAKKPSHDNSEYYLGRPRRTGDWRSSGVAGADEVGRREGVQGFRCAHGAAQSC